MFDYIKEVVAQIGIPLWLFVIVFIWSYTWKLLALWKSARKSSKIWFIVLALVNTMGILEILYIFGFSKMKLTKSKKQIRKKKKRR